MKPFQMASKMIISLILTIIFTSKSIEAWKTTIYPLANSKFDQIYQISNEQDKYFLHISCKEKNTLSISINKQLFPQQHPRFPVFGQNSYTNNKLIPRMQRKAYTYISQCPISVEVSKHQKDSQPFIRVKRKNSTSNHADIFSINTMQLNEGHNIIVIQDNSIKWGLGERFQEHFSLRDGSWTIYNRDRPFQIDYGKNQRSSQTYGHQPIYLARNNDNKEFHLVYFKNTFGMLIEARQNSSQLTYHSVGGNVQFIVMLGQKNPEKLIKHYHDYLGGIHIPPFWSLGWHQCRWGYRNLLKMKEVVRKYRQNNLPIDIIWSDLDYMQQKAIFTLNQYDYPHQQFKSFLQQQGIHWVPLIDVGVSLHDKVAISAGEQMDVFIKEHNNKNKQYVGNVWPGDVHFVDYLHANSTKYWMSQLDRLYKKVPFSGIWLDMNQPSNFRGNRPVHQVFKIQKDQSINQMTIDSNLPHACNVESLCPQAGLEHQQVHAYYGHLSTIPTFNFLKQHKRPFIISRSNSVGTGRFAGHWTGDNNAQWEFLKLSISGNFLFQIFGIQMVGADICGFHGNSNLELCARWMQLGSLYPFARNHNENISIDQEPYQFGDQLIQTSRIVLNDRYAILKQLYTELVNLNGTGTFFRPLLFQFPEDQKTYEQQISQTQFLIGNSLMSAPILQQNQIKRKVYFPGSAQQTWYDITNISKHPKKYNEGKSTPYPSMTLGQITNAFPSPVPLFLRGGHLIFVNQPQMRTKELSNWFMILGAFKIQGQNKYIVKGSILGLQNYQDESSLSAAIQQGGRYIVQIEKIMQQGQLGQFKLTWKKQPAVNSPITIQAIRILQKDFQWQYSADIQGYQPIVIDSDKQIQLEFKKK